MNGNQLYSKNPFFIYKIHNLKQFIFMRTMCVCLIKTDTHTHKNYEKYRNMILILNISI
jgi:hypothetical protein